MEGGCLQADFRAKEIIGDRAHIEATSRTLVNDRLAVHYLRPVHGDRILTASSGFDPDFINGGTAMTEFLASSGRSGSGRLCFYGAHGTGKAIGGSARVGSQPGNRSAGAVGGL